MIHVRDLSVTYHGADRPALSHVDLEVDAGQLVLVGGASGSGKSTLLLSLNGILQHESGAAVEGEVLLNGLSIRTTPLQQICRRVATVFQNPAAQICTGTPEREIAFGLENLALPREQMRDRIDEALAVTGLEQQRLQPTHTLSGGQQQRLMIAAALALRPEVLLMDEPTSQLDPAGAEAILQMLEQLKRRTRMTIVLVEHRLEGPLRIADQMLVLNQGRLSHRAPPREFLRDLASLRGIGLQTPALADLFQRIGREERPILANDAPQLALRRSPSPRMAPARRDPLVTVDALDFGYRGQKSPVFRGLSLRVNRGDRIALLGGNGAGKSTLLGLLAGSLKPESGTIEWRAGNRPVVGLVNQNPDVMLIAETVRDELLFSPRQTARVRPSRHDAAGEASEEERMVAPVLEKLSLGDLAGRAPFSLSRGERQRTAVGSVLTQTPDLLLLDEPTTGQDRSRVDAMMRMIADDHETVFFTTHDVETAARHANRVVLLREGAIVADGAPEQVLFDWPALESASIRPCELHLFAGRHGLPALDVSSLVEAFA